ncbi:MAG: hypothetical protein WCI75_10090 [candidate division NC10 bacterium]
MPQIRLRKQFWKKGGFWCLLLFMAAFPFIWKERVGLERKFRAVFLPKLTRQAQTLSAQAAQTLGLRAQTAYKAAAKLGREVLPEEPKDESLPKNPSASSLAAPDASPRLPSDWEDVSPEGLSSERRDARQSMPRLVLGRARNVGTGYRYKEEGIQVAKRKKYAPISKTPIAPGREVQGNMYAFQGSQEEHELPFFATDLGKGVLIALGFGGAFGLLGYVLLSVNTKDAKRF